MVGLSRALAVLAAGALAEAHTVITYPGWRGDNLYTNGTPPELNANSIGIDHYENGTTGFPFGMQWMYPCGGLPLVPGNRTLWPYQGGALAFQPGWFSGHSKALFYVNIGIQEEGQAAPPNYSHPVVGPFQLTAPTNNQYPGGWCIPQIGMPANLSLQVGQNITLQVIEVAQHGASLYSCVDLTLAEPEDVEPVTPDNCINSSWLGFNLVFTTADLTSDSLSTFQRPSSSYAMYAIGIATLTALLL